VVAVFALAVFAGACSPSDPVERAESYLDSAEQALENEEYSEAVIQLKNAIQAKSDYAPARLALGKLHLRMTRYADAEKELRRAIERGAGEEEAGPALVRALLQQGKNPEALEVIEGLPDSLAKSAEVKALHADALLGQGRRDAVRALLGSPDSLGDSRLLARLAQLAGAEGELETARRLADRAMAAEPPSEQAYMIGGLLAANADDTAAARDAFKRAFELDPYSLQAGTRLAQTVLSMGQLERAREIIDGLAERLGDRVPLAQLRGLIALQQGDYEAAKEEAERILGTAPRFRPALFIAGVANSALGNDETAISQLNKFTTDEPVPPQAYKALALSNLRTERPEAALAALERADLPASDEGGLRLAVQAALQANNPEQAKTLLREAVKQAPGQTGAAASLAALQLATGERQAAQQLLSDLPADAEGESLSEKARLALLQLRAGNAERALSLAEEIEQADETIPAGPLMAGLARVSLGESEAAMRDLERALEIAPGNRVAALALATLYQRGDQPEKAETVLRGALNSAGGDSGLLSGLVQLLVAQDKAEDAEALLRQMAEDRPEDATPRALLARLLLVSDRATDAIPIAEDAVDLAPENAAALETLGRAQLAAEQSKEAVTTFERLADLRPDNSDARFLLARAQAEVGNVESAIRTLRSLLDQAPARHDARIVLARLLLLQDEPGAAEPHVARLTEALPEVGDVIELQAALARARGERESAIKHYRRAYEQDPNPSRAMTLARLQWEADRREAAIATLKASLEAESSQNPARLRVQLGEYLYQTDALGEAVELYRSLVETDGDNAVYRNQLAWMLWENGQPEVALPHAEWAHELAPHSPEIKDTLGVVLLDTGKAGRAAELLRAASQARPENLQMRFHYARALAEAGQTAQARDLLRELAESDSFAKRDEASALLERIGG